MTSRERAPRVRAVGNLLDPDVRRIAAGDPDGGAGRRVRPALSGVARPLVAARIEDRAGRLGPGGAHRARARRGRRGHRLPERRVGRARRGGRVRDAGRSRRTRSSTPPSSCSGRATRCGPARVPRVPHDARRRARSSGGSDSSSRASRPAAPARQVVRRHAWTGRRCGGSGASRSASRCGATVLMLPPGNPARVAARAPAIPRQGWSSKRWCRCRSCCRRSPPAWSCSTCSAARARSARCSRRAAWTSSSPGRPSSRRWR